MADLLRLIVDDVKAALGEGAYDGYARQAASGTAPSLAQAVATAPDRFALLAEVKPRSPSGGDLLDVAAAVERADLYRLYGAAGVSVLTERAHFGGSLDLLAQVAGLGAPTLMKDFVVDERQLQAARGAGASAVLLIHHLFSKQLAAFTEEEAIARAHELGLEVLLEVDNDADFRRALATEADLIGVNARDLTTMELDADRPIDALRFYDGDRLVLALSGVQDRGDAGRYREAGARGILVGTALSKAPDPRGLLRDLTGSVHVKVCGVTDEPGLSAARGADAIGLIVATPSSPRNLDTATAKALAAAAPAGVERVAVTTAEDPEHAARVAKTMGANVLQWHRDADPLSAARMRSAWEGTLTLLVRVAPEEHDVEGLVARSREVSEWCDRLLLDTKGDGMGGTGRRLDPAAAARIVEAVAPRPVVLSGGLGPANVAHAVSEVGPWGVDASSGLEERPGVKDPEKVEAYLLAARRARPRGEQGPRRLRMM